jgi:hypothetical protein
MFKRSKVTIGLLGMILIACGPQLLLAEDQTQTPAQAPAQEQAPAQAPEVAPAPAQQGIMPFSSEPDTHQRGEDRLFPLLRKELNLGGKELPPPFGVMFLTNWLNSDWKFESAEVSLSGSQPISLDAAANATMELNILTNGAKADLWVLPFLDVMVGIGRVNIDAELGLKDIPLYYDPGKDIGIGQHPAGFVYGDAIVPMSFNGSYYSLGGVLAGAYERFYAGADFSWVKTSLEGSADLSADGFWTFTCAPKIGYNAGLSQIYIGARYISKNEHYQGTVPLPSGEDMTFDVKVSTASWVGNFGIRTVIREHWELLMESAMGNRFQITGGVGYRF